MQRLLVPETLRKIAFFPESLAALTSWGVGGRPLCLFCPDGVEETGQVVSWLAQEGVNYAVMGGGSNLLLADGDLPLALVATKNLCGIDVERQRDDVLITCGAGVELKRLFAAAINAGFSGLEFAGGIPGSVGGAVVGNAGTRWGDMSGIVTAVESVESDGAVRNLKADEIEWGYRRNSLADSRRIITGVRLRLGYASREAVLALSRQVLAGRLTQPLGKKTAGCVFKNPPGDSAGRLIEACGCKGLREGDAIISNIHANFIENCGNASASDILALACEARKRVKELFGTMLEFEVKIIGVFEEHAID